MAELVKQGSRNPTRKLTSAVIGAAFMSVSGLIIKNVLPEWYDAATWAALTPVVIFGLGYFTHDEATIVVTQDEAK